MRSIFTFMLLVIATSVGYAQFSEQYAMAGKKLELRTGPGLEYNVVAEIPQGTQVYVINSGYGDWSTIQYKQTNGFVLTNLLTADSRIAEAERAAREAEAKKAAAKAAAEEAIRKAEEAAKRAIAEAERRKREAEAEQARAIAAAEAAKKNTSAAALKAQREAEETRRALEEARRRAAQNGDVASSPIESTTASYGANTPAETTTAAPTTVTRESKFASWEKKDYKSGETPKSFGKFKGEFDYKLDNYLKINVGKNTEVVVKLVKMGKTPADDKTIRVNYIKSNSTQFIRNIPEGEYYCVIAYGKDWRETNEGGKVIGTFTKNALYEKGQDILNFNAIKTDKGINIPSYTLSLDLMDNGTLGYDNNEDQDNISPDKFNEF
ncbi:SH3 domain-containing protein [Aquimarina brevivitae]|uniref:SH3b domain-containing protein n=1 Tax=Aquimarina brevivitae TaxID=323412 RepID=A0A4Q7PHV1_9FLAO|nr:SH3 domain-containing protein [Aquimarina brevivitae]RZS99995.1 hypothetical protein EV197_1226 [Aquimarina brevivitae]